MKPLRIFMVTVLFLLAACTDNDRRESAMIDPVDRGYRAPDFFYSDINGNPVRLSGARGKVVVVFFWKMRCRECIDSIPSLERLYRRFREKGLEVMAVNADTVHTASIHSIREFIKEKDLTFTVIRDDEGIISLAFRVIRVPAVFVIDRDGIIVEVLEGRIDWLDKDKAGLIESLL